MASVIDFTDAAVFAMTIPNIIGLYLLAPSLKKDLQDYVKSRLAKYSYPREVEFLDALPMTVTGKVIRKELKARAAGEDSA